MCLVWVRSDAVTLCRRLTARGSGRDVAKLADFGQGPDVSWVVMAGPEGNEFCVLQPLAGRA